MSFLVYRHDPETDKPINGHASLDILRKQEIGPGDMVEIDNVPVLYTVQVILPGLDGQLYAILTYGEEDGHMCVALLSTLRLVGKAG